MFQYQNIKYSAYNEDIMSVSLIASFLVSLALASISATNSSIYRVTVWLRWTEWPKMRRSTEETLKVSIIIPAYNAEKYIKQCVDSCLSQTYTNFEIIAIDDGSTDSTVKILQEYGATIKVINKKNGGTASALNVGIK